MIALKKGKLYTLTRHNEYRESDEENICGIYIGKFFLNYIAQNPRYPLKETCLKFLISDKIKNISCDSIVTIEELTM